MPELICTALNAVVMFASDATSVLGNAINAEMLSGVFDELVAVLPVAMPVMVSCTGVRKGISFLQGILLSA